MVDTVEAFFSYSREDADFVDRLEADLRAREFGTWVDRQRLESGRDWEEAIDRAIARCTVMIAVLSPQATLSSNVRHEYEVAAKLGKRIVPVLYKVCPLPAAMAHAQWVNGVDVPYETVLRKLIYACQDPSFDLTADSTVLYNQALALESSDPERAAILFRRILDDDPSYFGGRVQRDLQRLDKDLYHRRAHNLKEQAETVRKQGAYGAEAGALEALIALGNDEPDLVAWAREYLPIALQNRALLGPYEVIQQRAASGDLAAARDRLMELWQQAPYFRDPAGVASTLGLAVPMTYEEAKARRQAEELHTRAEKQAIEEHRVLIEAKQNDLKQADEARVQAETDEAVAQHKARDARKEERRQADKMRDRERQAAAKTRDGAKAQSTAHCQQCIETYERTLYEQFPGVASATTFAGLEPAGVMKQWEERRRAKALVFRPGDLREPRLRTRAGTENLGSTPTASAPTLQHLELVEPSPEVVKLERQYRSAEVASEVAEKAAYNAEWDGWDTIRPRESSISSTKKLPDGTVLYREITGVGLVLHWIVVCLIMVVGTIVGTLIGLQMGNLFWWIGGGYIVGGIVGAVCMAIIGRVGEIPGERNAKALREHANNCEQLERTAYSQWQKASVADIPRRIKETERRRDSALSAADKQYAERMPQIEAEYAKAIARINAAEAKNDADNTRRKAEIAAIYAKTATDIQSAIEAAETRHKQRMAEIVNEYTRTLADIATRHGEGSSVSPAAN